MVCKAPGLGGFVPVLPFWGCGQKQSPLLFLLEMAKLTCLSRFHGYDLAAWRPGSMSRPWVFLRCPVCSWQPPGLRALSPGWFTAARTDPGKGAGCRPRWDQKELVLVGVGDRVVWRCLGAVSGSQPALPLAPAALCGVCLWVLGHQVGTVGLAVAVRALLEGSCVPPSSVRWTGRDTGSAACGGGWAATPRGAHPGGLRSAHTSLTWTHSKTTEGETGAGAFCISFYHVIYSQEPGSTT